MFVFSVSVSVCVVCMGLCLCLSVRVCVCVCMHTRYILKDHEMIHYHVVIFVVVRQRM